MTFPSSSRPSSKRARAVRHREAGSVMLAFLALLGIFVATLMVTSLNASAFRNEQDRKTNYALAQAKQALVGRAAADQNRPGSLPCPDIDNDGLASVGVEYVGSNCASYVGRLPWKTLGLPDLRDADGERLWYALSPNFRDASGVVINGGTTGTLSVTGVLAATNAAAIVFSPGAQVSGQTRDVPTASNAVANNPGNYLDGANSTATTAFVAQAPDTNFNDRLIAIAPTDLTAVTQKRVAREISAAMDAFFAAGNTLPYAADPSNPGCLSNGDGNTCTAQTGLTTGLVPAVPSASTNVASPTPAESVYLNGALGPGGWFQQNGWRNWVQYDVSASCTTLPACKDATPFQMAAYTGGDYKAKLTTFLVDSTGMNYTTVTQSLK